MVKTPFLNGHFPARFFRAYKPFARLDEEIFFLIPGKPRLTANRRSSPGPRPCGFQLGGQPEQGRLIPEPPDEVSPHRKTLPVPEEGHGHGRLAGEVADGSEGDKGLRPAVAVEGIVRGGIESSQ